MLTELKVKNFAIIDEVHIHFQNGLNVLSGETGSGKSVLLKSLALLMGEKSQTDTIKSGESQAIVEGSFDLKSRADILKQMDDLGISAEGETLIVRRIISVDGKNKVYINGSLATLQQVRDLVCPLVELAGKNGETATPLLEMTSQHENKNMLSRVYQLDLLDIYLGTQNLRQSLSTQFFELENLLKEKSELESLSRTRAEKLDFLIFQRDEIKKANLSIGDDEILAKRAELLKSSEKLNLFLGEAESALYGEEDSALVRIHRVCQRITEFQNLDENIMTLSEKLSEAKAILEDSVYQLRDLGKSAQLDPQELEETLEKLSLLRKLQKKHGPTLNDILSRLTTIEAEIASLENFDSKLESLTTRELTLTKEVAKLAKELHQKRQKGAKTLIDSVNSELNDLNMKGVVFGVAIKERDSVQSSGITDLEFTIQSGKNDEPRSLAKYASGGELSRILLSLKRVAGDHDHPRTYLFDEVDAGVSGVTAEKVGRKLKSIAKRQQVICVTHLPQVAAFADQHYFIDKKNSKGTVQMFVKTLKQEERIQEIARLLSGEKVTKASIENAKQLLKL